MMMQRWKGKIFGNSSSSFRFGNGSDAVLAHGKINSQYTAHGTGADTTEDTLFTYSLSQNSLNSNGNGLYIEAFGTLANNAHTKTTKLYFGTGVVLSSGALTTANVSFFAQMRIIRRASGIQTVHGLFIVGTTIIANSYIAGAELDTAAIVLKLTGQTATATANDVLGTGWLVRGLN